MKIGVINAALPPRIDGIGDYTAHLSAQLAADGVDVTLYTAEREFLPIVGIQKIRTLFRFEEPKSVAALFGAIQEDKPEWLLLQYNPFSYGRRGFNPYLPLVLQRLRRQMPDLRIALMAHETFVGPESVAFRIMRLWQVPQFHALMRLAHVVFFSIDVWAREWAAKFPKKSVHHLPVSSNIPRIATTSETERDRLGIPRNAFVVGAFGSSHVTRCFGLMGDSVERIAAMEQSRRPVVLLDIGPHSRPLIPVREASNVRILTGGPHTIEELSRRLATVDLYLNAYEDGVSTRRTTMMAGLQHSLPIAGTSGRFTDLLLNERNDRALLLSPVAQPERFAANVLRLHQDSALREQIGAQGWELFEARFTWNRIAARLQEVLNANK